MRMLFPKGKPTDRGICPPNPGPPKVPFLPTFSGEDSPIKIDRKTVGTLVLAFQLEDLLIFAQVGATNPGRAARGVHGGVIEGTACRAIAAGEALGLAGFGWAEGGWFCICLVFLCSGDVLLLLCLPGVPAVFFFVCVPFFYLFFLRGGG